MNPVLDCLHQLAREASAQRRDELIEAFSRDHPAHSALLLRVYQDTQAAPAHRPPQEGPAPWRVLGDYALEEAPLGSGRMGVVHRAEQRRLRRQVAVKLLRAGVVASPARRAAFLEEAGRASRLSHASIVPIIEAGEENGECYYAMKLIEGQSLAQALERRTFSARSAAELVLRLAGAVHHAHSHGVIHCDIKPGNVLLDQAGHVWITDFGVSRQLGAGQGDTLGGTPDYMALEQRENRPDAVGPATDVYALGVLLTELLCGQPRKEGPPAGVPQDLQAICRACLRLGPVRYGSAEELARDLSSYLAGEDVRARPVPLPEQFGRWVYRRRQKTVVAGIALVSAVLVLLGVLSLFQTREEYYAALTYLRGVPTGVGRLTQSEADTAVRAFRVQRRRGVVLQVDILDRQGHGAAPESWVGVLGLAGERRLHRHEALYRFSYAGGRLVRQEACDPFGKSLWTLTWESPTRAVLTDHRGLPGGPPSDRRVDLALSWDDAGLLTAARFFDPDGRPARLHDAGGGRDFSCESRGLITRLMPFLPAGNLRGLDRQYDERGRCTGESFLDGQGRPAANEAGVHRLDHHYPQPGEVVSEAFDREGQKVAAGDTGVHRVVVRYQADDHTSERTAFGLNGTAVVDRATGVHRERTAYRDGPVVAELQFFDEKGNSVWHRQHRCSRVRSEFDATGNLMAVLHELQTPGGAWEVKRREDAVGRTIDEAEFSPAGEKVLGAADYHRRATRYDEKGYPAEVAVYDTAGKPCLERLTGAHLWTTRSGDGGVLLEQTWFGVGGERDPVATRDGGYHRVVHQYDDRGRKTRSEYFGTDKDRRAADHQGIARVETVYDLSGNVVEQSYWKLDPRGELVFWKRQDGRTRALQMANLGPDGEPRLWKEGHHYWVARRDIRGNATEEAYFGLKGEKVVPTWGYHLLRSRYDAGNRRVEAAHFSPEGEPVFRANEDGSFRTLWAYDQRGNRIEALELGPNGRPVNNKSGWTRTRTTYDDSNRQQEQTFWKVDPDGVMWVSRREDALGRTIESASFTDAGQPKLDSDGSHRWTYRYDQWGLIKEFAYFGLKGEPIVIKGANTGAYHRRVYRRNDKAQTVEEVYLGVDGEPARNHEGSYRTLHNFDRADVLLETLELGPNSRPRNNNNQWARRWANLDPAGKIVGWSFARADREGRLYFWTRNDHQGRKVEDANLTEDGRQLTWKEGHHRWTKRYDSRGNAIEEAFFGMDGRPVVTTRGYHRHVARFDENGKYLEWAVFGLNDQPAIDTVESGAFRALYRHDGRGNRIESLCLGPNGRPVNGKDGVARIETAFDGSNQVVERTRWKADPEGRLWLLDRTDAQQRPLDQATFTPEGRPAMADGYHRRTVTYGVRGNINSLTFFGTNGEPVIGDPGFHRAVIRYDAKSQPVEAAFFDTRGEPIFNREGTFRFLRKYDARGNRTEYVSLGPNGRPRNDKSGEAKWVDTYDAADKRIERAVWKADPDGRLWLLRRENAGGKVVERANLTEDGRPQTWPRGHHRWVSRLDARGNIIEEAYFGVMGEPATPTWGYHRYRARYDDRNRKLEVAHFGPDGEPATNIEDGSFRYLWKHDARGNLVEVLFLGPNGRPRNVYSGYARRVDAYDASNSLEGKTFWRADPNGQLWLWKREDDQKRVLEQANLTNDGQRVLWKEGNHRWRVRYDARSNTVESSYFGLDGEPVVRTDGYHMYRARYNERGKYLEYANFGLNGEPAYDSAGSFRALYRYDERGNEVEILYLGPNGRPMNVKEGYAQRRIDYDSGNPVQRTYWKTNRQGQLNLWKREDGQGRVLEQANLTDDGQRLLGPDGYHRWKSRHDARGQSVETSYFGLDGEPVVRTDGYHLYRARSDERGKLLEDAHFGLKGEPANDADGSFRGLYRRDESGREVEALELGPNGRPRNNKYGWAKRQTTFASGVRTERTLWKADLQGQLRLWKRTDAQGRTVETANLTEDGRPQMWKEGYHRWTKRLDDRGNTLEAATFGPGGERVVSTWGFHLFRTRYDERGRKLEQAHFGPDGSPSLRTDDGTFRSLWSYDQQGKEVEARFLGPNGRPLNGHAGYARRSSVVDKDGSVVEVLLERATREGRLVPWHRQDAGDRVLEHRHLDADGKPVLDPAGTFHRLTVKYDAMNRYVERAYFSLDGKPATSEGSHRDATRYSDEGGHDTRSYDADGKAVRNRRGFHRVMQYLDKSTNRRVTAYFGTDLKPVLHADGYHRFELHLNEKGHTEQERFVDIAGQPVQTKYGYAVRSFRYSGEVCVESTATGLDGKAVPLAVVITYAQPWGIGYRLGLREGDVLVRYRGQAVSSLFRFMAERNEKGGRGEAGDLEVRRGKEVIKVAAPAGLLGVQLRDVAASVVLPAR